MRDVPFGYFALSSSSFDRRCRCRVLPFFGTRYGFSCVLAFLACSLGEVGRLASFGLIDF